LFNVSDDKNIEVLITIMEERSKAESHTAFADITDKLSDMLIAF